MYKAKTRTKIQINRKNCGFDEFPVPKQSFALTFRIKIYCRKNLHFGWCCCVLCLSFYKKKDNFIKYHTRRTPFHVIPCKWRSFSVQNARLLCHSTSHKTVRKLINVNGSFEIFWFAHVLPVISIKKMSCCSSALNARWMFLFLAWTIFFFFVWFERSQQQ